MRSPAEVLDWQRRFKEAPCVWAVVYRDVEDINYTHFYESEEAAALELAWHKQRPKGHRYSIEKIRLHTLELAKERWAEAERRGGGE